MRRNRFNMLPLAIGATVFLSLLPASWLGWTSDFAGLVRIPIAPVSHFGTLVASWVKPIPELPGLPEDEVERSALAEAERDHYRQLWTAQMLRATELADQLRELQNLPDSALRNPQPPMSVPVDVTGMLPRDPTSMVELKVVTGAKGRVLKGDIAVSGRDIVGRIVNVGLTRIDLQPVTNKNTGRTRAAIIPAHPTNGRPPLLAEVILISNGSTEMYADVPATSGVQKGDLVALDDPNWPRCGAGLLLGYVFDVKQLDEAPLRQRVVVVPRVHARDLSRVVLLGTGEESQ